MTTEFEDDLAREVVELLLDEATRADAGPVNRDVLTKRLKVRREGASAENRFLVLVDWLGHCVLAHRLDQLQVPSRSRDDYRVPDLFVVFETDGRKVPVLVEVKSAMKIVWTHRYLEQKRRYAEIVGLPLLLAWYHWPTGFWTLCDLSALTPRTSASGYELPLATAMENSLMSWLAGDFSYSLAAGLGMHFGFEMIEPIDEGLDMPAGGLTPEGLLYPGTWKGVIREVYFQDAEGRRFTSMGKAGMVLFMGSDQVSETSGEGKALTQSFVIPAHAAQFAHRVLPVAVAGLAGLEGVPWRQYLRKPEYGLSGSALLDGAFEGQKQGIVETVLRWRPKHLPSWLSIDGKSSTS
jgi:hypothetical protein